MRSPIINSLTTRECVICGGVKKPRFWVCEKCARGFNLLGKPYKEWPLWVRELIRLQRKESYTQANMEEVSIDPGVLAILIEDATDYQDGFFINSRKNLPKPPRNGFCIVEV